MFEQQDTIQMIENHRNHQRNDDPLEKVILGEAITLSTFMLRNNQRLSKANYVQLSCMTSSIIEHEDDEFDSDESFMIDPLLRSLVSLRSRLNHHKKEDLTHLDPTLIKPFCDVIVNKDVSGPVTGLALQAIKKFINYGLIKDDENVRLIAESVTKARFVGTDSNSDETVLMIILSILESLVVRPFHSLSNNIICEIMQSCFRIAFESRLSELLRKSAVNALTEMIRALFQRIPMFNKRIETDDYNYIYHDRNNASYHKLNRMGKRFNDSNHHNHQQHRDRSRHKISKDHQNNATQRFIADKNDSAECDSTKKHYGLACVHELLAYLTSLVNPLPDGQNTDYMIYVGLNLLIVIFEVAVQEISNNYCLLSVIKTDLCWNIQQLMKDQKNLNLFSSVLRLAFLLFVDLRMHLKYQFEAFLQQMMRIISSSTISLEFRDICMEYLLLFFRHIPYLPHELFFNLDCDPYSSDLLEDLLQVLSKNCFSSPTNNNQSNSDLNFSSFQTYSLEVLLSNLKSLQMSELYKEKQIQMIANPATMVVHISNVIETDAGETKNDSICGGEKADGIIEDSIDQGGTNLNDPIGSDKTSSIESLHLKEDENEDPTEVAGKVLQTSTDKNANVQHSSNNRENDPTINKYCVTYLFPKSLDLINSRQIEILKQRKCLLWTATEKFNQKPSKGIDYLYENHLIQNDDDLVEFLRNNSRLDKKPLGEYLSNKKNMSILSKFVQSFVFKDTRIDEALRLYLESFRLPGEAPLISLILEQFAHHWHESNGCPFVNEDAAFSLAYAIIMLNVDQHNSNVKRQTNPMTCEEFISNLRQVNGGKDFDRQMLTEIYSMIKNNEIVMPAEQQGVVREKYLWKCLLKNSETLSGCYWYYDAKGFHHDGDEDDDREENTDYYRAENFNNIVHRKNCATINLCILDKSIFDISWSPFMSTLTLVFDKLNPNRQPKLCRKVLSNGFTSYSLLCANFGQLDNLIENLSKFVIASPALQASTTPTSPTTPSSSVSLMKTSKSEMVSYCLFGIIREYANEMRKSWRNIIELILIWYDNKLLDDGFEIEDFALESKIIKFHRIVPLKNLKQNNETNQSTFLSSFYSYFSINSLNDGAITYNTDNNYDVDENPSPTAAATSNTSKPVTNGSVSSKLNDYCDALISIIEESKFLHLDSLIELIRALIQIELTDQFDDDIEVFKLEILLKIIFLNRDRFSIFWDLIYKHLLKLLRLCPQSHYLTERVISSIFRLAMRFTSRPDSLNDQIFLLLFQMLMYFEPEMIQRLITAQTLHSFVQHCNCYFTKNEQWALIFYLILAISIGYYPPNKKLSKQINDQSPSLPTSTSSPSLISSPNKIQNNDTLPSPPSSQSSSSTNRYSYQQNVLKCSLNDFKKYSSLLNVKRNLHESIFDCQYQYRILDAEAYQKCIDTLVLIVREYLPTNAKTLSPTSNDDEFNLFEITKMSVGVLCRFVEASIKIQFATTPRSPSSLVQKKTVMKNQSKLSRLTNALLSSSESDSDDEIKMDGSSESNERIKSEIISITENVSLKLLDLMHYFHLYAPSLFDNQISSDQIWNNIWCPLLQAISFFCCDCRRPVRTSAFTFLQRTLLLHDLQVLNAVQWESCFNKVLFPLLSKLLQPINMCDPIGMDETRMRATNLLCKVFLQHLQPLFTLETFTALWLTILDFMDKYIKADMQTELVKEAIPESLKNILLVMRTAGCFNELLASITWDRINIFLPNLRDELMTPQINLNDSYFNSNPKDNNLFNEKSSAAFVAPTQNNEIESPEVYTPEPRSDSSINPNESYDTNHEVLERSDSEFKKEKSAASIDDIQLLKKQNESQAKRNSEPNTLVYNLPSTFIDMESVYVEPSESSYSNCTNISPYSDHIRSESSAFQSNAINLNSIAYPGMIQAQFYDSDHSKTSACISPLFSTSLYSKNVVDENQIRQPLEGSNIIGNNQSIGTTINALAPNFTTANDLVNQSYPWPSPSSNEDS